MDDAIPDRETSLELAENKDLAILKAIIEDIDCDVGTHGGVCSDDCAMPCIPPGNELKLNERYLKKSSTKLKKSSFRLFIVPDNPGSDAFQDSEFRLSFDDEHQHSNESNSLRFSVTSNDCEHKTKTSQLLHSYKNKVKPKRTRNTFEVSKAAGKETASPVNYANVGGVSIDHQLMHSTNSSVLAWLRLKNFEQREKRKMKRRERKELRLHAHEEAEKKQKRIEESEKRFTKWLEEKKKIARLAWREKRARKTMDVTGTEDTRRGDNDPPPNYTIVPTFRGAQAWVGENVCNNSNETSENTNPRVATVINVNRLDNSNVSEMQHNFTNPVELLEGKIQAKSEEWPTMKGNTVDKNRPHLVSLDETNNIRPSTAGEKLVSLSGKSSTLSNRNTKEKDKEQKRKRPGTSPGKLANEPDTVVKNETKGTTHKPFVGQKQRKEKLSRSTTAQLSNERPKGGKKLLKKTITFETWKTQKRQEEKEKANERKLEVVDDTITEALLKSARKRIENSANGRKQLDTGMPKWRARNKVRSSSGSKSMASPSKYAILQLRKQEMDDFCPKISWSQSKEVETIQKFCENMSLS